MGHSRVVEIVPFEDYERATFYSLQYEGESASETEKFFARFKKDAKYKGFAELISRAIADIGNKYGAKENQFRPENSFHALPRKAVRCDLRLYCVTYGNQAVLLGNGGIKTSQLVKDSPDAFKHFRFFEKFERMVRNRISKGELTLANRIIEGDRYFEINF